MSATAEAFASAALAARQLSRSEGRRARKARGFSSKCSSGHHAQCSGQSRVDGGLVNCACWCAHEANA